MRSSLGLLVAVVLASSTALFTVDAGAHTPHDDIFAIALSPNFADDQTAYTISRTQLMRSTDGGDRWHLLSTGLDNRQPFTDVATTVDPDIVVASTRGDGVYRSDDGGQSWTLGETGLTTRRVELVALSPHSDQVVFAAGADGELDRSMDGGDTWAPVPLTTGTVTAIAFDPTDDGVVFVGDREGRLHVSGDAGDTWTSDQVAARSGAIWDIVVTAGADSAALIFVATELGGPMVSVDRGQSFEPRLGNLADLDTRGVAVSPDFTSSNVMWVSNRADGVFRSADGGESWQRQTEGLTRDHQPDTEDEYRDRPHFGSLVVSDDGSTLFLAGFDGLFRSADEGASWEQLDTLVADILVGLAISPGHASDRTLAITTYYGGAQLSIDGGVSWVPINRGLVNPPWHPPQEEFARLFNIVFSPTYVEDDTLVTATLWELMTSTSSGDAWSPIAMGDEPEAGRPPLRQFVIEHSPEFGEDQTAFLGTRLGEMFRSTDGGRTFEMVGELGGRVQSIVVGRTATDLDIFAAALGGVWKSGDGGTTWAPTPLESIAYLAISPTYADDGLVFAATRGGLLVTNDGGATWSPVEDRILGARTTMEAVAMSPTFAEDGLVLASARGLGLFRSTDGGLTFQPIAPELLDENIVFGNFIKPTGRALQFSPTYAEDGAVYGLTGDRLFRSIDAGSTWSEIDIPTLDPSQGAVSSTPVDNAEGVDLFAPGSADTTAGDSSSSGWGIWVIVGMVAVSVVLGGVIALRWRR